MIAKLSGKTAPPTPWIARAPISDQMFQANGQLAAAEENAHADQQQPLLPVLVAELPEDGGRDRGDEQEPGQKPGDPGRGGVEVALEGRERRDHHRLLERVRDAGDRQGRQRNVVMLALPRRLHHGTNT
jgi:hypothetical protein